MGEIPYYMGTTALYDTGRNSLERRPISNKIPTPAMGSHESGCPSSFLHKYWDCGGCAMRNNNRIEVDIALLLTLVFAALRLDDCITWPWFVVLCVGIKNSVTKARFYSPDVYDIWEYEVQEAVKEGNIPPTLDEVRERYTRRAIMNPATDFDLGWNALGVQPPFLGEGEANPDDSLEVSPGEAPAAYPDDSPVVNPGNSPVIYPAPYPGDSPTVCPRPCPPPYPNVSTFTEQDVAVDGGYERASDSGQWQMADEEGSPGVPETQAGYTQEGSDSISIEDYAATNIFSPPRKEGDF